VFRHGFIFVNRDSGIREPKDLEGRRIGVRGFRQTAGLWIRGILRDQYDVSLKDVQWVEGGVNWARDREATLDIRPEGAPNIAFAPAGKSLNDMLAAGEIDALIGAQIPEALFTAPNVHRLFPDYRAVEREYFRATGIYPTMHTIVMREELYRQHPWIAESLFKGFEDAKAWARTQMRYVGALRYMLPWLQHQIDEIDALFAGDPFPYGLEAARVPLEAMVRYLLADGFLSRPVPIDDLFAPLFGFEQKGAPVTG
jgi:4,5-dihydroxyphthalate decarboxylase